MNRRNFLKNSAVGLATVCASSIVHAKRNTVKPNIVIINVDDLGWTDLTCFGSKYYRTPNIDKLRSQGMKFTDAYAACAVCSPTRAAIMTGRYPSRIGITDWIRSVFQGGRIHNDKNPTGFSRRGNLLCPRNHMFLEHEEITIPELLKPAGYVSCHIGKWHLGPKKWYPETQGFDFNLGGCDYGQPPSYFDPYKNRKCKNIPTLPARRTGEYLTDREADEAVSFITKHRNKPFFLNMCHYAVHTPIQGKKELKKKYAKIQSPTKQKNASYAAMVESVDDATGKIISTLEKFKLMDNTVLFFTSDNGGLKGPTDNTPLRMGKGYPYEGGIRIPQIVRWDGVVKPNSVCKTPVISIDFFPTIADILDLPLPANRTIDGESIVPLLKQTGGLKRDSLLWHFPHFRGKIMPYSIIRCGDWKLIKRYAGTKKYELFNLKNDLSEKHDLAKKIPAKVKELDKKLAKLLKDTNSKVPFIVKK